MLLSEEVLEILLTELVCMHSHQAVQVLLICLFLEEVIITNRHDTTSASLELQEMLEHLLSESLSITRHIHQHRGRDDSVPHQEPSVSASHQLHPHYNIEQSEEAEGQRSKVRPETDSHSDKRFMQH